MLDKSSLGEAGRKAVGVVEKCKMLAQEFILLGEYARGEEYLLKALSVTENTEELGGGHAVNDGVYQLLFQLYTTLGEDREAVVAIQRVFEIRQATVGIVHPSTAEALVMFATSLAVVRSYPDALGVAAKAMEIYTALGEERGVRMCRVALARINWSAGDFEVCLKIADSVIESLASLEEEEEEESFRVELNVLRGLAFAGLGMWDEADTVYAEVLDGLDADGIGHSDPARVGAVNARAALAWEGWEGEEKDRARELQETVDANAQLPPLTISSYLQSVNAVFRYQVDEESGHQSAVAVVDVYVNTVKLPSVEERLILQFVLYLCDGEEVMVEKVVDSEAAMGRVVLMSPPLGERVQKGLHRSVVRVYEESVADESLVGVHHQLVFALNE